MDRKSFIKKNLIVGGALTMTPLTAMAIQDVKKEPIFSHELITEFVFAAHKSLDETKKILQQYPLLLNCANQFTKGDFETAVGGASHMGRKDIADFLVAQGARLDIFNYAFLGYDDFVKKIVQEHPHVLHAPGPHGFTLLHHAQVGNRTALADWLQSKGLTEKILKGIF